MRELETDGRDPVAIVDADSADSGAGARADPLRAHARLGVHVLPRRCEPDGARPGARRRGPASTPSSAATRTSRTSAASRRPSRDLVFDLNDFDETLPGPFEWDVKRLAASVEIAGRDRGFDDKTRRACVLASVRAYREGMRTFAGMGNLELWYSTARRRHG